MSFGGAYWTVSLYFVGFDAWRFIVSHGSTRREVGDRNQASLHEAMLCEI